MRPGVVLVTGGAGFVGSEVVRRLCARGHEVHVLVRPETDRRGLDGLDVRWHVADVEQAEPLAQAVREASGAARGAGRELDLVHLAARISYRRRDRGLLERVNVEGTRRVLGLCATGGVRRVCHVSSVVALGAVQNPADCLDDDAPLGGLALDSAYARTKARSEELALAAAGTLDVVVASPAVVFGLSRSGSNSSHFLGRVARGTLGPFSPPGSISVVGLADTAEGIVRVLEGGARGRRYLLAESAWSVYALLRLACERAGRAPPRVRLPRAAWTAFVAAAAGLDRVVPSRRATPEALALLGMHFRFKARRARAELGWTPRPFSEVLDQVLAGMSAAGTR